MSPDFNPVTILRSPAVGGFSRVSRTFAVRLGYLAAELAAEPLLEWIHPEDRGALQKVLAREAGCTRARHRTKGGAWISLEWTVRKRGEECFARGLLPRAGAGSIAPTEHASAAAPRTTMAETLDAMARIVEQKNPGMRCSILLVDEEGEHVTVGAGPSLPPAYNAAVEGLRIGPAVGSCGTAVFWNMPVIVENIATDPLWRDLRDAAAIADVSACWSQPITALNGDVLGAMALYDTEPSVPTQTQIDGLEIAARMVGLAIERDRLEERLHHAAKMEALGVMAGGIAHDFNNMLAIVMGNAELAMTTLPDHAEAKRMLREIVTASINATELCNQMLAYVGRGATSRDLLDCNELVKEIGGLLRVTLTKQAQLAFQQDDLPLYVLGDHSQVRQVVMNLITNASEAIGDGEGRIVITTGTTTYTRDEIAKQHPHSEMEPGKFVSIQVSDDGVGMSAKAQAQIFDPFFSTKATGRGLGLAAVQGIVGSHKGAIALESRVGHGTKFTVLLPLVTAPLERPLALPPDLDEVKQRAHLLATDDEE